MNRWRTFEAVFDSFFLENHLLAREKCEKLLANSFAIVGVDTIRASADRIRLSAESLIVFSNAIRIFTLGFIGREQFCG